MNREHISNEAVLLDVRRMTCAEGRGKGVDLFRVTNLAGLDFDVLIDRCLGIGSLRVDGQMISYTSETGIVHPSYYNKEGFEWLRSFGGGFLATCGLRQVGEPCEGHGLHGRIDNIPAEEVSWKRWWEGDTLWAEISGTMYEACHQGEYLRLRRSIRLNHREKKIWVEDGVENLGAVPQPIMLLYHINMGAPFLKPGTVVTLPESKIQCFDEASRSHVMYSGQVPDVSSERLDLLWLHHPVEKKAQRRQRWITAAGRCASPGLLTVCRFWVSGSCCSPEIMCWPWSRPIPICRGRCGRRTTAACRCFNAMKRCGQV